MKIKKTKAHTIYKNQEGKRLPGATTIIGILAKPALVNWANRLGLEGVDVSKYVDDLAGVGTLAHELVCKEITGKGVDLSEYSQKDIERAENALKSFNSWKKDKDITPVLSEQMLISEKYQFGGAPDLYGKINGDHILIDFKTSNAIYDEHFIQLGAYKILLEESGHKVDKAIIVRIGRTSDEGFETRELTDLSKYEKIFRLCLEIYKLRRK